MTKNENEVVGIKNHNTLQNRISRLEFCGHLMVSFSIAVLIIDVYVLMLNWPISVLNLNVLILVVLAIASILIIHIGIQVTRGNKKILPFLISLLFFGMLIFGVSITKDVFPISLSLGLWSLSTVIGIIAAVTLYRFAQTTNDVYINQTINFPTIIKDWYCMVYGYILSIIGFISIINIMLNLPFLSAIDGFLYSIPIISIISGIQVIRVIPKVLPLLIITLSIYLLIFADYSFGDYIIEMIRCNLSFGNFYNDLFIIPDYYVLTIIIAGIFTAIKLYRIKKSQQSI